MNPVASLLKQYSDMVTKIGHHALLERFVLRNGKEYDQSIERLPIGEPRMCFMNATIGASRGDGVYTEGFAMTPELSMPIHHAWLTVNGRAVDVTWRYSNVSYIGLEFPVRDVRAMILETGYYGMLCGEMYHIDLMRKIDPDLVLSALAMPPPMIPGFIR